MAKLIQYCTHASHYDGAFDSKVGWAAAGMGYIIVTDGGHLIAIDGGFAEDAQEFVDLLRENSRDDAPTVDLWIITHPHGDHYFALQEIARREALRERVNIKTLMYHFPEEFRDRNGNGCAGAIRDLAWIAEQTGAAVKLPQVDEHIDIDGLDIHMLYTPTDCSILNNPNQLSLIFTVQGPSKKLMITGDAYHRNMQIVVWRYDKSLACDILQLPHHGLCDTGNADFYRRVGASTVLIPISVAGDRTMRSDMYGDAPAVNRAAEDAAQTVHKAFDGTVELAL